MRGVYGTSARIFGAITCALGVAMIVATVIRGGGPLALGVVVGVCFVLLGAGRLYLAGQS